MKKLFFLGVFSFLFFLLFSSKAQIKKIGIPFITNYDAKAYGAASENWDLLQNEVGAMFFGNHFGLLQFDGVRWNLVMQPSNKSMIWSLATDKEGKIFIGAQGDFGYGVLQPNGQYFYTSFAKLLPKSFQEIGDVWRTIVHGKEVVFFTKRAIYLYSDNKIKVFVSNAGFEGMYELNNQIYVLDSQKGMYKLKGKELALIEGGEKLAGMRIIKLFGHEESMKILTYKDGFFIYNQQKLSPWLTEVDYLLKEYQVSCATNLFDGFVGIGTRQNGLIIIDNKGSLVQHINKQSGLQNDYVTNLKTDKEGNLWLTLKDGIDYVEISSPLSRILDNVSSETKINCSLIYQNKLYIGTDNGLFWLDWEAYKNGQNGKIGFKKVTGIYENVWNLGVFGDALLAFEANGTFQIKGIDAQLLAKTHGAWQGVSLPYNSDLMIVGGYSGLNLYKKIGSDWTFQHKIKGFQENSRVLSTDKKGNIWVAHGYKGVYKIKLDQNFDSAVNIQFYDQQDGFPSNLFLNTFQINGQVLFGTTKGVYRLNESSNKMEIDPQFQKYLGLEKHIRLIRSDNKNNIWFVAGNNTGVIHQYKDGSFHVEELDFRKLRDFHVPGFENIQISDDGDVFFGTQNGLIHYSSAINKKYQTAFKAFISDVRYIVPQDSILFRNKSNPNAPNVRYNETEFRPVLAYKNNSLSFKFSSFWYEEAKTTQYQYWLEGFGKEWSQWTIEPEKEYTNLPEGDYIFHVKAKNLYDTISQEDTFSFEIRPPWYRTIWAYLFYLGLFCLFISGIIRYQRNLAKLEREQLIANQEKELLLKESELAKQKLMAEQEKMNIVRENLETTISLKNSKVASNTVNLIYLNEILLTIREHIQQMEKNNDPKTNPSIINKINRIIEQELQGDHHWKEFEEIFNQLHSNFIQKLKSHFPELTPRDIRMCAYLRMNLNTKEIAPLLGISVRGVEDTRYRIRKKVNLSQEANLTEFILNF
jgi:ligand-binding sensor domain-containing protein